MSAASGRLFAIAAAMAAGVLGAETLGPGVTGSMTLGALAVLACACGAALARTDRAGAAMAAALLSAAALGACLAGMRLASLERGAIGRAGRTGADALLHGRVLGEAKTAGGVTRFTLGVDRAMLDGRAVLVRERVAVSVRPPPRRRPDAGDRLRVDARLAPVNLPGATAAARSAARRLTWQGIAARGYARPDGIEPAGGPRSILDRTGRIGRRAVTRPVTRLPAREAGLLLGMTIGDTSRLDAQLEADFRTTGLTHLLAVSGGNLVLFLGSVAGLLRLARAGRRSAVGILAVALLAFMAVTRFEPSVMRAGLMGAVGLAGVALGAQRETPTALAATAIALVAFDPFIIHAVGFQLSALATLGILVLGPRLRAAMPGRLGAVASITIAAQLAVAPLIALTFHSVSVIALVANLLAAPAVGPVTVLGVASAPLGAIWDGLGVACVTLARPFLWWMSWVAGTLARVPHASIGTPGGALGALSVAGLVALALLAARAKRPPRPAALLIAFGLLVSSEVWANALSPPPVTNALEVVALDVGQGDAVLVRAPGGATMLVDGGPEPDDIVRRLAAHRVGKVDLLVMTHGHADHVNGLVAVARRMEVGRALDPGDGAGEDSLSPSAARYLDVLDERGIPRDVARAGGGYRLGPAFVDVLGPGELLAGTASDLNNNSVVLRVRYGRAAVLLAGEVQEEGQLALLERAPDSLRAQVFKVPHHGSARFLREFYASPRAEVALITVGANPFGHPTRACLDALAAGGVRAYRTDRSGDVTAYLGATGSVEVREERRAAAAA